MCSLLLPVFWKGKWRLASGARADPRNDLRTCVGAERGSKSSATRGGSCWDGIGPQAAPSPGVQLGSCPPSVHTHVTLLTPPPRVASSRPAPRRAASTPSATCFPARSLSVCTWAPDSHSRSLNRRFRNTSMHTHKGYGSKEMRSLFSRSALSGRGTENCHPAPRLVGGPARRWPPRGGRLPLPASPVTSLH